MYASLIIQPFGGERGPALWPDKARQNIAAACGDEVPPEFFAHGKRATEVEGAVPLVVFGATKQNGYRLTGLGREGVRLLREMGPLVFGRLAEHLGVPCSFSRYSGDCAAQAIDSQRLYRCGRLALTRKPNRMASITPTDRRITLAAATGLIQEVIAKGVVRQAQYLDDTSGTHLMAALPDDDGISVDVLDGQITLDPISNPAGGRPIMALVVKNLVFSVNIDLAGPWFVGAGRSKGYGEIRQEDPHARA